MAGQDVALAGLSAFGTGQNAFCNVPYIHEVIPAANGKGQPSGQERPYHGSKTPSLYVTRSDDAGGKDNAGIQPTLRRVKDQFGCGRLALCVIAVYKTRREVSAFRDNAALRFFRYGMDGADINESSHIVLHALPEDPPCAAHIDLIELRAGSGRDGDNACAVDHTGTAVGVRKEVRKRAFITHIAGDGTDLLREQADIGVVMQHKRTHLSIVAYQLRRNGSAEEAGSACN